jgi:hypothetical protein
MCEIIYLLSLKTLTFNGNFGYTDAKPWPHQSHAMARVPYVNDASPTPSLWCQLTHLLGFLFGLNLNRHTKKTYKNLVRQIL